MTFPPGSKRTKKSVIWVKYKRDTSINQHFVDIDVDMEAPVCKCKLYLNSVDLKAIFQALTSPSMHLLQEITLAGNYCLLYNISYKKIKLIKPQIKTTSPVWVLLWIEAEFVWSSRWWWVNVLLCFSSSGTALVVHSAKTGQPTHR